MTNYTLLKNNRRSFYLGLIIFSLLGCSERGMMDLKTYAAKIKARENPHVDTIPEFRHIPSYFYEVQHMRDPFIPLKTAQKRDIPLLNTNSTTKKGPCPNPTDSNRVRVGIEMMPLDTLKMTGTLEIAGTLWALIVSSENTIYRVKQGDYMGENYGKIINISENKIEVLEQIPDGEGCWKEFVTNVPLFEG
ncbi:pilus assembly protein PilP [Candidatus Parabeggiatoa sp. HSG14]|uniref:pilus assembly protein PilP n=1 Tax=Candidatus Parabeggiatoa sp. HSG14 TaxID=3055593 RepID=UPI0025A90479|nr:pilus assembly protein PilP [Thiotrichales bacterium HSG14]